MTAFVPGSCKPAVRLRLDLHHTRIFRQFIFFLVPLAWALGQGKVEKPAAAEITLRHQARSLQPGEVVLLEVESKSPIENLQAQAFQRNFPCFAETGNLRWTGLLGIDLNTKPGRYTVRVNGRSTNGRPIRAEDFLTVVAKEFPTRKLTVDEKFVNPPKEEMARIQKESARVSAIFDAVTPRRFWDGAFLAPVPGPVISEFGKRNIYNGQPRSPHAGTDFQATTGTPIRAPNAGRVVLADNLYYSGNTVILDHGWGLYSYFGHLSAFSVKVKDEVKTGQVVGKVGATGRVTGPHLHWSVRLAGTRVDPLSLLSILGNDRSKTP
jgi:murein DD-endopeptidase MepM/ murein hydrolase activator NlpD